MQDFLTLIHGDTFFKFHNIIFRDTCDSASSKSDNFVDISFILPLALCMESALTVRQLTIKFTQNQDTQVFHLVLPYFISICNKLIYFYQPQQHFFHIQPPFHSFSRLIESIIGKIINYFSGILIDFVICLIVPTFLNNYHF